MRRLLLRLVLLTVPWLGLWIVAEWLIWKRTRNPFTEKLHALEKQRATAEVLVLGSSHGYRAVLPSCLKRPALNLAMASQPLYYDVEIGLRSLERMPALKLIIQPVSYFSLESRLEEGVESWRIYQYSLFYGIPPRYWRMRAHVRNCSLLFGLGREASLALLFKPTLKPPTQDEFGAPLRWGALDPACDKTAEEHIKIHHRAMRPDYLEDNISRLRQLASKAKQRGVKLALITTPCMPEYRKRMKPENYARMQTALEEFARQESIGYWNFLDNPQFTQTDYYDPHHLSRKGAEKFSRLLEEQVIDPLLLQ